MTINLINQCRSIFIVQGAWHCVKFLIRWYTKMHINTLCMNIIVILLMAIAIAEQYHHNSESKDAPYLGPIDFPFIIKGPCYVPTDCKLNTPSIWISYACMNWQCRSECMMIFHECIIYSSQLLIVHFNSTSDCKLALWCMHTNDYHFYTAPQIPCNKVQYSHI